MRLFLLVILSTNLCVAAADSLRWVRWLPEGLLNAVSGPPKLETIPRNQIGDEIRYGMEIFSRSAYYLGPKGIALRVQGNSMNCQNCHINAGRQFFGGYLASTFGKYPTYRERNANIITLEDRINQCIARPMNGRPLPYESREMKALVLYFKWLGTEVPIGSSRFGDELAELPYISRASDPMRGKLVFETHCVRCHGADGLGQKALNGIEYTYPPLWGNDSYTIGSSMHRVRKAAAFIKFNMPFGTTWRKPELSDEEAYDVAAFINDERINPRPKVDVSQDYPRLNEKPIDYPYGPYEDPFSEEEHRFGPFDVIKKWQKGNRHMTAKR